MRKSVCNYNIICDGCADVLGTPNDYDIPEGWVEITMKKHDYNDQIQLTYCESCAAGKPMPNKDAPSMLNDLFAKVWKKAEKK